MELNRNGINFDRDFRNKQNDNWSKLETENVALRLLVDFLQKQIDALIVDGDSSPEAAQARTDTDGVVHPTLNARLIADFLKSVKASDLPYTKIGNAVEFLDSAYLGNDKNLFGRLADGSFANLATMEQNDIAKLGDALIARLWIAASEYVSIRAPKLELVEQSDASGNGITPTRTVYHIGNFANHALIFCTGQQSLTKGERNTLTFLDSPQRVFPAGAWSNNSYRVPRTGFYLINLVVRPEAVTEQFSWMRLGYTRNTGSTVTNFDMSDKIASSTYETAFITGDFTVYLAKDDVISLFVNPLTENLTIGSGSKVTITFQTDTPAE